MIFAVTTPAHKLSYRRIVVKLGTSVLTAGTDRLDPEVMAFLVGQVADLRQHGAEIIVVSSGAIAAGRHKLRRLPDRELPQRQVLAAVGQGELMHAYDQLFASHGVTVAQALVSRRDLMDRAGYLNVRNTLLALLDLGVVPIVNENDVVATEEIEGASFGDNDNLSAMVANLVDTDLLALLTDTAGLYTADPVRVPDARLIPRVDTIDSWLEQLARDTASERGVGGMATKVQAARLAMASGVAVVIAYGREPNVLARLARGEALGTLFVPTTTKLESRKRWMLSGIAHRGALVVDDGAAQALLRGHGSLLPVGIREVTGEFSRGDIVDVLDSAGRRLACGIANYSSVEVARVRGRHSAKVEEVLGYEFGDEVVHRNNLVLV